MQFRSPLLLLLISRLTSVVGLKDVTMESFSNATNPSHVWISVSDPVMGGQSNAAFIISSDDGGLGVFEGEVKDVPSLSAPGFITVRTTDRGGYFPDVRSCDGLKLRVRSQNPYDGFRLSIGTNFAGTMRFAHGYHARFDVPDVPSEFQDVLLKFTKFSDNWDPRTGNIIVSCEEDQQYCPDDETLQNMERLEIMAEGVNGKIKLEIQSIIATNCDDDVSEADPNPEKTAANRGGNNGNRGGGNRGQFGNSDMSGFLNRDENAVGGNGGWMFPTILENGDIRIESFDNPQHRWYPINDPVMGGSSTSTVKVMNEVGVFDGEVVDVSFLGAPGFIKMETRGGSFPNVSMCKALKINLKSRNDYNGIRVTMGTHHADNAQPYVRGYKAHVVDAPMNEFGDVILNFSEFSDKWDPKTGNIIASCQENLKHCVDEQTLQDFTTFSIMGEGVDGKVHLEVKSIDATGCKHSASEIQTLGAAYGDVNVEGVNLGVVAFSGIFAGFLVFGALAFISGRRYERKPGYVEPPSVEVVSSSMNVIS